VDDFIPQPFELADMRDAIATARAKLQRARANRKSGQVICVTRAKGGMGASTLAAHLALALCEKPHRRDPEKQVALLDLDLQFGDLALMLDLEPNGEMVEIIRDPARLDGALLRASMTRHKSGLFVLPAPGEFVPLDALPVAAAVKLIELAREEFDFVVCDLPLAVPRWLEAVLQRTDQLYVVSQLNVAAIRQTRRMLDFIKEEGHYDVPVSVVLNRHVWRFSERGRLKQAARALGQPIDHYVPEDAALALEAVNRGTPLFELRRRAKLCRSLREVAAASVKIMQQRDQAAGPSVQAA
jgi:pilus assembly protein CpaE